MKLDTHPKASGVEHRVWLRDSCGLSFVSSLPWTDVLSTVSPEPGRLPLMLLTPDPGPLLPSEGLHVKVSP